jgi:2-polyprenyl-6-methoxyphenol hydroxylase-like FAD-dependent oxidoreductase
VLVEPPLWRLPFPSVADAEKEIAASPDASMPLEPYQLISQYTLEPLLKSIAEELPAVAVRYGHELTAFTDNGQSVTGHIKRLDGTTLDVTADYLVACDGGGSGVRKQLDIKLQGDANIGQFR